MDDADSRNKQKIIDELETMKAFELSAHELYAQIAGDSRVAEPGIKTAFASLARDEKRHADLVQEIINITANAL